MKRSTYKHLPGFRIGQKNNQRVKAFFTAHLCATNRECSEALGISEIAVGRHVRRIRETWINKK